MKKQSILIAVLLLLINAAVFAQEESDIWWGTNYTPGNFLVGGTFGVEAELSSDLSSVQSGSAAMGFSLAPQVEMMIFKPVFAGISPLDFGVAAKGRTGFFFRNYDNSSSSDPWFPIGLAAMGTMHLGFKGFNVHFSDFGDTPTVLFGYVSRLDYYLKLGIAVDLINGDPEPQAPFGITFSTGLNYFINDHFIVTAEYGLWNGMYSYSIGASLKLGKGQKTKTVEIDLNPLYYQVYLGQFYALYWYSFYAGGFYFDDSNYKEGEGTVWRLTSKEDPEDVLDIEKALLKINSDGSKWWKVKYSDEGDEIVFEFLIDSSYNLIKLRFRDTDTGKIKEYEPSDKDIVKYRQEDMRTVTDSDYGDWNKGKEKIKTPAGTFTADHLVYTEDGAGYEWWITEKVPGNIVKFSWYDSSDKITGILNKITKGNKSELNTEF